MFVSFLRLKRAWRAFSFDLSNAIEKLPVEEMNTQIGIVLNDFDDFVVHVKARLSAFLSTSLKEHNFGLFRVDT